MLFLLSPAKSLDYETPPQQLPAVPATEPLFVRQSAQLIAVLRKKSPQQVAALMDISDALSALNVARYQAWRPKFTDSNSRQAVLAFNGDVYDGLQARTLKPRDLAWAQDHVRILSGLYGVLRPLDRMQPYRLEMGTKLETPQGKNLYAFWGAQIAEFLNEQQADEKNPVVVNLASQEYFKSVDRKALRARVVECVFEEFHGGKYKIISFPAKRARGLMARYAVLHRVASVKKLQAFDSDGYVFTAAASTPDRLVFRRSAP